MIAKRASESGGNSGSTEDDLGDLGAGSGTGKGKRRGGAAGGGDSSENKGVGKVDLPNYKINDVRQRSKYISFTARRALDGLAPKRKNEVKQPENLKALADPATQKTIEQMVAALDKVMEQTDLAPPKAPPLGSALVTLDEPKKPETNDERLRNALKSGISSIESIIGIAAPSEQQAIIKSAVGG